MLDRQKIEAILTRRFPGATPLQIAAATNAIMGLRDDFEARISPEIADRLPQEVFPRTQVLCDERSTSASPLVARLSVR